ncbi:MAG: LysE family translocator [Tistlia sp.]|uniref:LysE family translocator n=1 Tax=Tistlia sp. TaxID=3057121 RepID=UPI0034A3CE61
MLDQIFVVAGITVLVMVSPGPDMVIVLRNTLLGGRVAGLKTSAGVLAGNLVHIAYCAVGVGWLISQSILAFAALKYAGAAYLIYLGVRSLLAAGGDAPLEETPKPAVAGRTWFVQGFLNNILNPKGTLFYLGVFTLVITPQTSAPTVLLLVAIMMAISATFWLGFVCTLDLGIVRTTLLRCRSAVERLFGGLLIFLGLRVAVMER